MNFGSRTALLKMAAASTVLMTAACSHATLKPSMALVGSDGSWAAYVQGCELRLKATNASIHLTDPQVLVSGRTILLNSETRSTPFSTVYLNTEQVTCSAAGAMHEQTASGCLGTGT